MNYLFPTLSAPSVLIRIITSYFAPMGDKQRGVSSGNWLITALTVDKSGY
ncbi:hypothetical protein [Lactiplantibacillus pentosus]|nr:hypothetical protein [Lactiplantibacillus pentosus]